MTTALKPPPPPLRPPPKNGGPVPAAPLARVSFEAPQPRGQAIEVYGPGGIGKTSLAIRAPGPVAVFDLDNSLPVLQANGDLDGLDVRVVATRDWAGLRAALQAPGWDEIKTVVIDSVTRAEEMALDWTLANIATEKGSKVQRIEDYGYGKGYRHLYDTFLLLLGDLDNHLRAGRNVVLVAHDVTALVPNPMGEDYQRFEPRLQSAGKESNVRARVREWADHLLFIGYDLDVKKKKASGSGTRTIYPVELPHCMAKSRTLAEPIPFVRGELAAWDAIFGSKSE